MKDMGRNHVRWGGGGGDESLSPLTTPAAPGINGRACLAVRCGGGARHAEAQDAALKIGHIAGRIRLQRGVAMSTAQQSRGEATNPPAAGGTAVAHLAKVTKVVRAHVEIRRTLHALGERERGQEPHVCWARPATRIVARPQPARCFPPPGPGSPGKSNTCTFAKGSQSWPGRRAERGEGCRQRREAALEWWRRDARTGRQSRAPQAPTPARECPAAESC